MTRPYACVKHGQVQMPRWIGRFSVKRGNGAPKCSCTNSVHAPPGAEVSHSSGRIRPVASFLLSLLLTLSLSLSSAFAKSSKPTMVPTTPQQWAASQGPIGSATLQVTFQTIIFDRGQNVFSRILSLLPEEFAGFKLNTIGRKFHSTWAYLDKLNVAEIRELVSAVEALTPAELAQYDLFAKVLVFDPTNIEIITIGHGDNQFFALKPHAQFRNLQARWWKFLKERCPSIYARHLSYKNKGEMLVDPENVHISLVQFGQATGLSLTHQEEEEAKTRMIQVVQRAVDEVVANGGDPRVFFTLQEQRIELVTSPVSIHAPPTPILTFAPTADGRLKASEVGRLLISEGEEGSVARKLVEFDKQKLVNGDPLPITVDTDPGFDNWIQSARVFAPTDDPNNPNAAELPNFTSKLSSPVLKELFLRSVRLKHISASKYPAEVCPEGECENPNARHYVASMAHPKLAPQKAFKIFDRIKGLRFESGSDVFVGLGIYASSVREEIGNPGDYDLVLNTLVTVPDVIATQAEAESYAVRRFMEHVFGYLIREVRAGRVAISELRVGSKATMGYLVQNVIEALEANPYLSEQQVLDNLFRDDNSRTWDIEELIGLGDFIKLKLDHFLSPTERIEISLQCLLGYSWRGATFFHHKNALKGISPLLRTAVYQNADSYAVAASLSRASAYYSTQKGPIIVSAIRELMRGAFGHDKDSAPVEVEPIWKSKVVKNFYNFLILLHRSGLGLDRIFIADTLSMIRQQDPSFPDIDIKVLIDDVLDAINQPELGTLNALRRVVNDFSEFNERQQEFRYDQLFVRLLEMKDYFQKLDLYLTQKTASPEFYAAMSAFRTEIEHVRKLPRPLAIRYVKNPALYKTFSTFEKELTKLEGNVYVGGALSPVHKKFMKAMAAYSPHIYFRYLSARSQDSEAQLEWTLRMLNIKPQSEQYKRIRYISDNLDTLPLADFTRLQRGIFTNAFSSPDSGPFSMSSLGCEDALHGPNSDSDGGFGK